MFRLTLIHEVPVPKAMRAGFMRAWACRTASKILSSYPASRVNGALWVWVAVSMKCSGAMPNSFWARALSRCQTSVGTAPASTVTIAALAIPLSTTMARAFRGSSTPCEPCGSADGVMSVFAAPARSGPASVAPSAADHCKGASATAISRQSRRSRERRYSVTMADSPGSGPQSIALRLKRWIRTWQAGLDAIAFAP